MRNDVCLAVVYKRRLLIIKKGRRWGLPREKPRVEELDIDCIFRIMKQISGLTLKDLMPIGKFNGKNLVQWSPLRQKVFLAKAEKAFFEEYSKFNDQIKWIKNLEEEKISRSTGKIFWILKGEGCL